MHHGGCNVRQFLHGMDAFLLSVWDFARTDAGLPRALHECHGAAYRPVRVSHVAQIDAQPYVPGQVRGVLSRDPRQAGAILVLDSPQLPACAHPAGIAVVDGAPFSHPMLALLARGIPTVIVTLAQAARLPWGEVMVLDGARGTLASDGSVPRAEPSPVRGRVTTADGAEVTLRASVRDAAGVAWARERGAESIGLVRSEFLVPETDSAPPDRAFYHRALASLLDAAAPLAVTIRLLDIAADKHPPWLTAHDAYGGLLGLQGMRLFETEPVRSVVDAEIAVLAELAGQNRLRVLLPYVTHPGEARDWCQRLRVRLTLPIGVMAENPAAALAIDTLLETADFVALGTNDLMQCLFGADRDLPTVRDYLDPYAPILYRFLAEVAQAAGTRVAQVQVCGLLAQLPGVLPVLLGLGYRCFSVDPVFLPWLAETVRNTRSVKSALLAAEVCHAGDSFNVRKLVRVDAAWGRAGQSPPRL
jgi:phosphoenolpyruvate-protein kinase (PTS system EI component)